MGEFSLEDIWRIQNPNVKQYTWSRNKPNFVGSRLDYFLTETGMATWVTKAEIKSSYKSDHRSVMLEINIHGVTRGNGTWKLNTSYLANSDFVAHINRVIQSAASWAKNQNAQDRWDSIKMIVTAEAQEFCRKKAKENKQVLISLENAIEDMENRISQESSENDVRLLEKTKRDLEDLMALKTKGIIFRAKSRWYNEGEKCTKYFLNLEKSRARAKGMAAILNDTGQLITNPREIIKMQRNFYAGLYAKDNSIKFSCEFQDKVPQVPQNMCESLNQMISEREVISAIKSMARNKTPGSDGLPIEFYITFWSQIKDFLLDAISEAFHSGRLHDTALEGIVTLIPKKDKDSRYIKNMRPITLLNVDYKIVEKVLADRIKPVLYTIIHENQKAFMKGRHIGINIRKVIEV